MSQIVHQRSNTTAHSRKSSVGSFISFIIYKVKFQPLRAISTSSANDLEHHLFLIPWCSSPQGTSKGHRFPRTSGSGFQGSTTPASPGSHRLIPVGDQRGNGLYYCSLFQSSDLPHLHVKKMFSSIIKCSSFSWSSSNA